MFNLKKNKVAQVVTEKYLRNENLGPKADNEQPIPEKILPHRTGDTMTITEDQMDSVHSAKVDDTKIIEKVLNDTVKYTGDIKLDVPPINSLVAELENERLKNAKTDKKEHWTQTYNENKQQGKLPTWPKMTRQNKEVVLNNDPRRFDDHVEEPTHPRDLGVGKVKSLVGGITTADLDRVVNCIKTGASAEYDIAITAILKEADNDKRELTDIEKRTVSELKKERTRAMMV